ncbi:hypothetical protein [Candidatus Thiodictyon syntrophicum]|jgi:hypothetical protein|nr:hypothetical protein [Candidatus Thiodictyon syntrophicum]
MRRPLLMRLGGRVLITLTAALSGAGCVTPGDLQGAAGAASGWLPSIGSAQASRTPTDDTADASLTPAERRLREQSRAFQKTVWEGALIGAGAGTLYGLLRRERAQDVVRDALIGGAVGGLAGAYIAHKQQQYSGKEDQLDSMIADVRKSNEETQSLIVSVRQVIAEDKRRLAAVEQQVRKGQASQAQLVDTRRRLADNQRVVAQASSGAREKQTMFQGAERQFRQDHPGTDTARMQRELDTYNKNLKTLDSLAQNVSVA